jgi:Transposase and inactivated derivatives
MGRLPRIYIEGVLYYVTSSGGHGESIFRKPEDYKDYISLIASYKQQYGFKLFAFCILPDHLHMLIELRNSVGISSIMHDINSRYTKNFNSRYGKRGHLFQDRFRTVLAEKDPYLLPVIRYIHLNPKRKNLAEDPKEYPYSSHRAYLDASNRIHPDMKSEIDEVFGALRGSEAEFDRYVNTQNKADTAEFRRNMERGSILGPRAFAERIRKMIRESARQAAAPKPQKRAGMIYIVVSMAFILVSTSSVVYFYKKEKAAKTKYDATLAVYERTLAMLNRDKEAALKASGSAEDYDWKIRAAKQALADVKDEKERKARDLARLENDLGGYSWTIELKGPGATEGAGTSDKIFFENNRMNSAELNNEGFQGTGYTRTGTGSGSLRWETFQTNNAGQTASWRGEWDGKVMKGVLSRRQGDAVKDFSFVSVGDKTKR